MWTLKVNNRHLMQRYEAQTDNFFAMLIKKKKCFLLKIT